MVYSDSYVNDIPALLTELKRLCNNCRNNPRIAVYFNILESVTLDVIDGDKQLLACWLICEVLRFRCDELTDLFHSCQLLKQNLHVLLSALFPDQAVSLPQTRREHGKESLLARKSEALLKKSKMPDGPDPIMSSIPVGSSDAIAAQPSTTVLPDGRAEGEPVTFLIPESLEVTNLLLLCSEKAEKRKYARGCCVRKIDDGDIFARLQAAVKKSRVNLVFTQQSVSFTVKGFLLERGVVCVDRLGKKVADEFSRKLGWLVYENSTEWLFSLEAADHRRSWKCWTDIRQSRAGVLLSVYAKRSLHEPLSIPAGSARPLHLSLFPSSVACERENCLSDVAIAKLFEAWRRNFLFRFHIGGAFYLAAKCSGLCSKAPGIGVVDSITLGTVLDALCLLCRCQL
jgi:hypothetical protein